MSAVGIRNLRLRNSIQPHCWSARGRTNTGFPSFLVYYTFVTDFHLILFRKVQL